MLFPYKTISYLYSRLPDFWYMVACNEVVNSSCNLLKKGMTVLHRWNYITVNQTDKR